MSTMLIPLKVRGHRFTVRVSRVGSTITASCDVPTRHGPIVVSSSCDARLVAHVLRTIHGSVHAQKLRSLIASGADPSELEVAGFFDDIGEFFTKTIPKEAKKLSRSKVFADVAKGIGEVTNHPAWTGVMAAVNVIPGYGQAISAAMAGMKMAGAGMNLLAQAKSGDPKAVAKVKAINAKAEAGDPTAQKAMGVMKGINKLQPKPSAGQQAATGVQAGLGMASQMAKSFGGDSSASKAVQGAANLGGSIASAFKPGANAGDTAAGILGGLGQFASAFSGDDSPPTVGGFPGYVGDADYEAMKARLAAEPPIDMAVGEDGSYVVAGHRTSIKKPFRISRRVKYGLPAPRFVNTKKPKTQPTAARR